MGRKLHLRPLQNLKELHSSDVSYAAGTHSSTRPLDITRSSSRRHSGPIDASATCPRSVPHTNQTRGPQPGLVDSRRRLGFYFINSSMTGTVTFGLRIGSERVSVFFGPPSIAA